MCGRMTLTHSADEVAAYFALLAEAPALAELRPRYNIAPGQDLLTVSQDEQGELAASWRRWGLVPAWSSTPPASGKLFNARSETAATKPSFRAAYRRRRCLVPASGFYEWTPRARGREPYYFEPVAAPMLAMAGLFESWVGEGGEVIDSCTVLTTEASADLESVHHRMPVLLSQADGARWLSQETPAEALADLLKPAAAGSLKRRPVDRRVGQVRNDDPLCLAPPSAPPDSATEASPAQAALFPLDSK